MSLVQICSCSCGLHCPRIALDPVAGSVLLLWSSQPQACSGLGRSHSHLSTHSLIFEFNLIPFFFNLASLKLPGPEQKAGRLLPEHNMNGFYPHFQRALIPLCNIRAQSILFTLPGLSCPRLSIFPHVFCKTVLKECMATLSSQQCPHLSASIFCISYCSHYYDGIPDRRKIRGDGFPLSCNYGEKSPLWWRQRMGDICSCH